MRSLVLAFLVVFVVGAQGFKTKKSPTPESTICNQECLKLGYDTSYYKDGQCWCYNAGASSKQSLVKLQPSKPDGATTDASKCNRTCVRLGLDGGFFKDGHCWCYGNEKIGEAVKEIRKCNQECVGLGMSGGFRQDGHCWCFEDEKPEKVFTKVSLEETQYRFQVIPIKNADCNKECIKAGMNGGFIKDGQCVCFELEEPGDAISWSLPPKPIENPSEVPNCHKDCTKVGMSGGYMKDGQCWCYKLDASGDATLHALSELQNPQSKSVTPVASYVKSSVKRHEAIRDCNADCVKVGTSGGYFKDGQCWCYQLEVSGDATLHALSELENAQSSSPRLPLRLKHAVNHIEIRSCNKDCVKNGWTGGYVKDGQCWCYQLEASGDATLELLPESGRPGSPSYWKPVEIRDCNADCIKVGMSGGYFKDDKCLCYELEASGDATLIPLEDIQSPYIEA